METWSWAQEAGGREGLGREAVIPHPRTYQRPTELFAATALPSGCQSLPHQLCCADLDLLTQCVLVRVGVASGPPLCRALGRDSFLQGWWWWDGRQLHRLFRVGVRKGILSHTPAWTLQRV